MSIARRVTLACSFALLVAFAAGAAEEKPRAEAEPAPESTPAPSDRTETAIAPASKEAGETAAEPVPPVPKAPPVMPATVVTPNGVQGEKPAREQPRAVSLGRYGAIELGRPAQAQSRWRGFPISLSLRDAPLPEVLRSFARIAGVNLVLHPGVTGTVTVELHDVPWDQALYVILKTQGMAAEIDGRVWIVEPN